MNVIFLDIDGVLLTPNYQIKMRDLGNTNLQQKFDPCCMDRLVEIINATDSNIVISSTWRYDEKDIDIIKDNFIEYGIKERIIGITPDLSKQYGSMLIRGREIQKWLDENKYVDNFVILDDDNDMFHLMDKLAECDYQEGLTEEVKELAIKILRGDR